MCVCTSTCLLDSLTLANHYFNFQVVVQLLYLTKNRRKREIDNTIRPLKLLYQPLLPLQFIRLAWFCISSSPHFPFLHSLSAFLSLSFPPSLSFFSTHFPLSALMQQSRKRTHLSGLMAAGGVLCAGGGCLVSLNAWL